MDAVGSMSEHARGLHGVPAQCAPAPAALHVCARPPNACPPTRRSYILCLHGVLISWALIASTLGPSWCGLQLAAVRAGPRGCAAPCCGARGAELWKP